MRSLFLRDLKAVEATSATSAEEIDCPVVLSRIASARRTELKKAIEAVHYRDSSIPHIGVALVAGAHHPCQLVASRSGIIIIFFCRRSSFQGVSTDSTCSVADIFDLPCSRSSNRIGTSTIRWPRFTAR